MSELGELLCFFIYVNNATMLYFDMHSRAPSLHPPPPPPSPLLGLCKLCHHTFENNISYTAKYNMSMRIKLLVGTFT